MVLAVVYNELLKNLTSVVGTLVLRLRHFVPNFNPSVSAPQWGLKTIVVLFCLSGCAERVLNITDKDGKIVGSCNAGFDWHFYGLQDSIDYMLYECAKDSIAKGFKISDERLLILDFTLPQPPEGNSWNKKLAMHHFHSGTITERNLGYILAAIEYEYQKVAWPAEDDLASGKITQAEFNKIIKEAKFKWLGE